MQDRCGALLPGALCTIAADRELFGAPTSIYLWLLTNRLDVVTYSTQKLSGVATSLHVSPATVRRSIDLLVRKGYLHERACDAGGVEYRLTWTAPQAPLPEPARRGARPR